MKRRCIVEWQRVNELERVWKQVEELSSFLLDETEEIQKYYSDFSTYEQRFESGTSTFESGVIIVRDIC
jgi:hypothetical protein